MTRWIGMVFGGLALVGCDPKAEDTGGVNGTGDTTTEGTSEASMEETGTIDSGDTETDSATETAGEVEVSIAGPTAVELFKPAGLSASVSGAVDSYSWLITAVPDDSELHSTTGSLGTFEFLPDAVGQYTVELVVTNGEWESEPALHTVDVGVDSALYVVLMWDTDDTDLDLHLAAEEGALFEQPLDINFCHPRADWGEPGDVDDPALELDDLVGHGPEIISLEAPAEGDYRVRVHHFTSASDGNTEATVHIFVDGALAHRESMTLAVNDVWDVGVASWPSLAVEAEDVVSVASVRECY